MVVCMLTDQINDFNIEGISAKSTAMLNLVKSLKAQGAPIDGIGLQAHLTVGEIPSTLQANMERFTALGIEVAITELDIRMTLPETPALLEQQKQDYQTVVSACNAVPGCIGVTVWGYTDRVSLLTTFIQFSCCRKLMMTIAFSTPGSRYSFLEKELLVPGMRYVSTGTIFNLLSSFFK